ncbi:hypothetical protein HOD20_08710 [archaeon]|jgi:hypothetical protein|nr:hypothetical protein [archaeon]MBT4352589.1 hypothetical protein [archaeon]MBT4647786.1 hypothetical protein [archaeon]MBT6821647.1 hypothetical protein [archaeon]MBT7391825.1 hypothetical protein [archaeon]
MVKNKKWSTTKLIATGSFGVLIILFSIAGLLINAITGSTHIGGALNSLANISFMIICVFVIDKFWSATFMYSLLGILALSFPLLGPAGFALKIPMVIITGIIADIGYKLYGKNKLIYSITIGGPILLFYSIVLVELSHFFNVPGFELASKILYSPIGIFGNFFMGSISGVVGYIIYIKIKNTTIVKRIQR